MSSDEIEKGSDLLTTVLAAAAVITIMTISEDRYQPENFAERMVGYFVLLPDLVTSDDIHPRDFIASLTGEGTGNPDAEVARNLDDEILRFPVEILEVPPETVWRQEYDRRGLVMEVTPENIDHETLRWRVEGYNLEPGSVWRDEWDRRVSENPNLLEEVRAINPHTGQELPQNP